MTTGSITSGEAGGIALGAALFRLFFVILAFRLAIQYSDTTAVKICVRGWENFVAGLVWVPVHYGTITFGIWLATEADLSMQTV